MMEIGTVISLLLLLVGALNYGNTMAASLQSRNLTFAIMESLACLIGRYESFCERRAAVCLFFYYYYHDGRHTDYLYMLSGCKLYRDSFFRSALPLVCSGGLLVILCIGVPLLSYRRLRGNPSIVERLREYEE